MIRPISLPLVALTLILGAIPATASAQAADPIRSITVQGTGSIVSRPDMAVLHAGVETRAAKPGPALEANSKALNALIEVLARFGVAADDIETTSFNVNPVYSQQGQRGSSNIEAFQVSNQLAVRVRDLDKLGALLSALVEGGANRLHGVSFQIAEVEELRDEARRLAVEEARHRAELYAAAAGVKIIRILSIAETGGAPPMPMFARTMRAAAESVPIAPGEQTVNATVTVSYEID